MVKDYKFKSNINLEKSMMAPIKFQTLSKNSVKTINITPYKINFLKPRIQQKKAL